jgi:signal transduction histidine kinase
MGDRISELEVKINEAIGHTRDVARGLVPVVPDGQGLSHALNKLAESVTALHGIECQFVGEEKIGIAEPTARHELYRIAQEAIANAIRHSQAKHLRMSLRKVEVGIEMTVEDDGVGIRPAQREGAGIGLRLMNYRAGLIRGQLTVRSGRGRGTEVICVIPEGERNSS